MYCFNREWTGDLKKLPNIKFRQVSNKGLDKMKEDEMVEAGEDDGDDKHNQEDDDAANMSDSD